jgi:cytochrome P450
MDPLRYPFPFPDRPGIALDPAYLERYRREPMVPVLLRGEHPAWIVTRHADVRTVLTDPRFSREAWAGGTLFARDRQSLALAASDPPVHTRRRRAVLSAFTHHQAELDRPWITRLAEELLDGLVKAGPPAELVEAYTAPLAFRVICRIVGVPETDIALFRPWATVLMSAGRFGPEEVASAGQRMQTYVGDLVRGWTGGTDNLLTALLNAPEPLSEKEIVHMVVGLILAGGDTTANHAAMCALHLLRDNDLANRLRERPDEIPAAVEELLRWVWFLPTGGQPHVVLEDVELSGVALRRGDVTVPLTDAANRDPAAIPEADRFDPCRTSNLHLGFGYGRHLCLGAPHARVELQVALGALLRRLPELRLAERPGARWRDGMFLRGLWSLPVTWPAS